MMYTIYWETGADKGQFDPYLCRLSPPMPTRLKPIVYVQNVHDDYKTIVKMNFTQNEILTLEKEGLY